MDEIRLEDLYFGIPLALVALVSIVIFVAETRRASASRDPEIISLAGGFGLLCALFSLVLCTGWINILPLPR